MLHYKPSEANIIVVGDRFSFSSLSVCIKIEIDELSDFNENQHEARDVWVLNVGD